MYPLNMKTAGAQPGHAVANDEAEHQALTALGYEPPFAAPQDNEQQTTDEAQAPEGAAPAKKTTRKAKANE